jgi:hypothetical protein
MLTIHSQILDKRIIWTYIIVLLDNVIKMYVWADLQISEHSQQRSRELMNQKLWDILCPWSPTS